MALCPDREGKLLGWRRVRDAFQTLEKWVKVNGGVCGGGDVIGFREIVGGLDTTRMPSRVLRSVMRTWEVVDGCWVSSIYERKDAAGDNVYEVEYSVAKR